jgi:hypothetical protein
MITDEPSFFDALGTVVAFARRTDPDTSREAAEVVSPVIRQVRLAVLQYAESCGAPGFTDVALNAHFASHSSTYRTRRRELVDLGMIEDTGERVTVGDGGRRHAVWRITWRGLGHLQPVPRDEAA